MSRSSVAPKPMVVAGIMSGTSADGADVAMCRVSPGREPGAAPRVKVLAHRAFPYPQKLRAAVLASMDAQQITTADLARLSWRLGSYYADCIAKTINASSLSPRLIACHGQTVFHQASEQLYLGKPLRCTWQIGEASLIAEKLRLPVVSDFRPADLAAGGQGAPLVPMLDFCTFSHLRKNRLLLNLGGIANFTALPAGGALEDVIAFDTGPANMVIDACMKRLFGKGFDRNGRKAAEGNVLKSVLETVGRLPYFAAEPPKSCGREEFGEHFVTEFISMCERLHAEKEDIVATATALTASTIFEAYRAFCWPHFGQRAPRAQATELFVAGGGAHNATLMELLSRQFSAAGVQVETTAKAGLAVEAKEAAAFALLGWLTWHGLPGNVPSATGASRAVVLGKVTHAC